MWQHCKTREKKLCDFNLTQQNTLTSRATIVSSRNKIPDSPIFHFSFHQSRSLPFFNVTLTHRILHSIASSQIFPQMSSPRILRNPVIIPGAVDLYTKTPWGHYGCQPHPFSFRPNRFPFNSVIHRLFDLKTSEMPSRSCGRNLQTNYQEWRYSRGSSVDIVWTTKRVYLHTKYK